MVPIHTRNLRTRFENIDLSPLWNADDTTGTRYELFYARPALEIKRGASCFFSLCSGHLQSGSSCLVGSLQDRTPHAGNWNSCMRFRNPMREKQIPCQVLQTACRKLEFLHAVSESHEGKANSLSGFANRNAGIWNSSRMPPVRNYLFNKGLDNGGKTCERQNSFISRWERAMWHFDTIWLVRRSSCSPSIMKIMGLRRER